MGLILLVAAQHGYAESAPYSVDRSPPLVIDQTAESSTVQFGPVRFKFPAGWSFSAGGTMSEGVGPRRGKVYVSVLRTTPDAKAGGFVPIHGVDRAMSRLARHVQEVCATELPPTVHRVAPSPGRAVIAAGCEVAAEDFAYIQYEIYTTRSVVQVMTSQLGALDALKLIWDEVIRSQVWAIED